VKPLSGQWHSLGLISVVSGENVGGMDAAVEPTGTYSRRFPEEMIGIVRPTCRLCSKVSARPLSGSIDTKIDRAAHARALI
jgi:hypothetical protein